MCVRCTASWLSEEIGSERQPSLSSWSLETTFLDRYWSPVDICGGFVVTLILRQDGVPTIGDIYEVALETEKGVVERLQIFDTPGSVSLTRCSPAHTQTLFTHTHTHTHTHTCGEGLVKCLLNLVPRGLCCNHSSQWRIQLKELCDR